MRGELYLAAVELQKQGRTIFYTNTGNPHALKQKPMTWPREVLSLLMNPDMLDHPSTAEIFSMDSIQRAREIMKKNPQGLGGYTDSKGLQWVREDVAKFIETRDGYPSNPDHIWLTDGASVAVRLGLQALIRDRNDSILVPIPQYPLYSASIELLGGSLAEYIVDEDNNWGMSMQKIMDSIRAEREAGRNPRALVFINPGNPTGNVLSAEQLKELALLAHRERLVLLADEVYQENVYQDERPFVSMKKVINDLGAPYANDIELMSFQTVSKGSFGECGLRGGYVECCNIDEKVLGELYKLSSINLAPNTVGQVAMSLMMNGPRESDPSYGRYNDDRKMVITSLRKRAKAMTDGFNAMTNVSCNFTEGAMYAFPRIHLPPKAMEAAKASGKEPDVFYCLELLKATGISVVPGSGFGQEKGTYHLRTTILPPEEQIPTIVEKFREFNEDFMKKYI